MPTRVLCLHGMGTNASIFKKQTESFRSLLSPEYEFVFIDGPRTCDPDPVVKDFFPGPYRCWYTSPSTGRVAAAYKALEEALRKHGAFDVIMGFSQGAAVAASYILHRQNVSPGTDAPFKAAIFICSPIPFSSVLDYGIDTRLDFRIQATKPVRAGCQTRVPGYLITDAAYLRGEDEAGESGSGGTFYQMFHHTVDKQRIEMRTVHIFGKQDKWRLHSGDLYNLCRAERAAVLEHDAGHEIPSAFQEEIADIVEGVLIECQ